MRTGVQPVGSSSKNLVFMVCLLYTRALTATSPSKLRRTPAACCREADPRAVLGIPSTQPSTAPGTQRELKKCLLNEPPNSPVKEVNSYPRCQDEETEAQRSIGVQLGPASLGSMPGKCRGGEVWSRWTSGGNGWPGTQRPMGQLPPWGNQGPAFTELLLFPSLASVSLSMKWE